MRSQGAVATIIEDLHSQQRTLCHTVLAASENISPQDSVESWVNANRGVFERATAFAGLKSSDPLNLAMRAFSSLQMRELIVAWFAAFVGLISQARLCSPSA